MFVAEICSHCALTNALYHATGSTPSSAKVSAWLLAALRCNRQNYDCTSSHAFASGIAEDYDDMDCMRPVGMALYKNWSSVLIAAGVDFDLECERNLLSLIEMGGDESDDEKISVDAPTANQVECITSPNYWRNRLLKMRLLRSMPAAL